MRTKQGSLATIGVTRELEDPWQTVYRIPLLRLMLSTFPKFVYNILRKTTCYKDVLWLTKVEATIEAHIEVAKDVSLCAIS